MPPTKPVDGLLVEAFGMITGFAIFAVPWSTQIRPLSNQSVLQAWAE